MSEGVEIANGFPVVIENPEAERHPAYVHCRRCNVEWVLVYMPLKDIPITQAQACGKHRLFCPMCCRDTKVYPGRLQTAA
jgi:hypothetical protein